MPTSNTTRTDLIALMRKLPLREDDGVWTGVRDYIETAIKTRVQAMDGVALVELLCLTVANAEPPKRKRGRPPKAPAREPSVQETRGYEKPSEETDSTAVIEMANIENAVMDGRSEGKTVAEISKSTGYETDKVCEFLNSLIEAQLVVQSGTGRKVRYVSKSFVEKQPGLPGAS